MNPTETAVTNPSRVARPPLRRAAFIAAGTAGVAALAALLISGGIGTGDGPRVKDSSQAAALAERVARQLNAEGPVRMDPKTTRLGVSAEGSRLVYRMGLSENIPAERIGLTRARLATANAQALCTDPDTSRLIAMGGSFQHIYMDASGNSFGTVVSRCEGAAAKGNPPMPRAM
jgi:hypothetical protein